MPDEPSTGEAPTLVPEVYLQGVRYVQGLTEAEVERWLVNELMHDIHALAGQPDDFPVHAILNHWKYLSLAAQGRISNSINSITVKWMTHEISFTDEALQSLFDIAVGTGTDVIKEPLQGFALDREFRETSQSTQLAVLQCLAGLARSYRRDVNFWETVFAALPEFAGMSFQVLARIAPRDAVLLVARLPSNPEAQGGAARALPALLSTFDDAERPRVFAALRGAMLHATRSWRERLKGVMRAAGYAMTERSGIPSEAHLRKHATALDELIRKGRKFAQLRKQGVP